MPSRRVTSFANLILILAVLAAPSVGRSGDFVSEVNFAVDDFFASPRCPVRDFPRFETIVPIPDAFDPFLFDDAIFDCFVDVEKNDKGVKKAKGTWETELIVRDNMTGEFETFPIDSGKFKTDAQGQDSFDFEIPSELFADGFESGDVSAWSYTRSDFTNKKKADRATVSCGKGASKDND